MKAGLLNQAGFLLSKDLKNTICQPLLTSPRGDYRGSNQLSIKTQKILISVADSQNFLKFL